MTLTWKGFVYTDELKIAPSGYRNLELFYASVTQVSASADRIILEDADGYTKDFGAFSETIAITSSGANGLDTGSEAISTWYHVWAIGKADGTLDGLLSASATAPTLPSGYTFKLYLGAAYNNASGNFNAFRQLDKHVTINETSVLTGGTAGSYTSVSIANAVPSTAKSVIGLMFTQHTAGATTQGSVASTSAGLGRQNIACSGNGLTSIWVNHSWTLNLSTAQTIYYFKEVGTTINLGITGYSY